MDENDIKEFAKVLNKLEPSRQVVLLAAMELFMECCQQESELSAVLIVKKDTYLDNETVLNIAALNADMDDAYDILNRACIKVAADIAKEAPSREQYN